MGGTQKRRRKRNQKRRRILRRYKQAKGCRICGLSDYRCLEFHHRPNEDKRLCPSSMVRYWGRVKKEIKKCDVLCSNCHKIEHFNED